MYKTIFLYLTVICYWVSARDSFGNQFIKSFIEYDNKPTFLILYDLCWSKNNQINLINEVSKLGTRSVAAMELNYKYQDHDLLYLLDLNCTGSHDVIYKASSKNLFRSPHRWLILTNSTEQAQSSPLWNSPVLADSDVVLAERNGKQFRLVELHKASPNGSMISTPRGFFNGSLIDVRPYKELYKRRKNIMGHTLTMANVIQDDNSTQQHIEADNLLPQYDNIPKLCWMNVKIAFEMLNATPAYIFSYRWGFKVNGQWSGMVHDLYTGRADLGTNCAVFNTERLEVVSYTDSLAPFKVRFIYRQPPLPYITNIFSLPFSKNVWIAIAVCAVVSTVTIYLASKHEVKFGTVPTRLDGSIGDAMLMTMGALSQQGCEMEPKRTSGRIMLWVIFAALMALYAAYSANIVVLLQAPTKSIKTLQQLASSKISLAANDVDYNHFVFKVHDDPVRLAINKKIDPKNGKGQFYNISEGVEKIRQGLFAFHSIVEPVYRRIEQTFLESEKCDLMEVDYLNSLDPFVPVKKDSPYLELLRVTFKQLRESGIKSALTRRLQVPKPRCSSKTSAFSSVGLIDMRPVLILMVYGIVVSAFIVMLEIIVFKINKCRNKEKARRIYRNH